ncbi:hypothetical protein MPER_03362, partial [Moniliophthora perniciosa FA553]
MCTRPVLTSAPPFSHTAVPHVLHANRYRSIIVRVALYPIVSCCVNLLGIIPVIHTTISDGVHSDGDYNVLLLSDFTSSMWLKLSWSYMALILRQTQQQGRDRIA